MRKFIINVNNKSYEVEVEEVGETTQVTPKKTAPVQQAAPAPKAAPVKQTAPAAKVAPIASAPKTEARADQEVVDSPMPGNIWEVLVKEGQEVKEGEVLLILEAMKMENEITSPRAGVVASILTEKGAAVNTGDKLVLID